MLSPSYTNQFEKDIKKIKKRNKDITKLKTLILALLAEEKLTINYRNHKLVGSYYGRWECHIEPDWLLIYRIEKDRILFERTGTHSDLFK